MCTVAAPVLSKTLPANTSTQAIAQSSSNITNAQQLEQQARDDYAAGRWREAANAFTQAAQQYAALGDIPRQSINLSNLSLSYQQLGFWDEASEAIANSLALVENEADIPNSSARQSALAQALDIRGTLQLAQGQAENAIDTWERAATIHTRLGKVEQAQESQINQARALQSLGMYSRAIAVLQDVLKTSAQSEQLLLQGLDDIQTWEKDQALEELTRRLETLPNSPITVAALRSLGEALEVRGNLDQAAAILQYGLGMAETLSLPDTIASTQLSLGNVTYTQAMAHLGLNNMKAEEAIAQLNKILSPIQKELQAKWTKTAQDFDQQLERALDYYAEAAQDSNPPLTQTQAQLNRLKLLITRQRWAEAEAAIPTITALLDRLPLNRATFDAYINLAQSLLALADPDVNPYSSSSNYRLQAAQLLATASQQAIALNNNQAQSQALGLLGEIYLKNGQWSEAEDLTQQALVKVNAVSVNNLPQMVNDVDLAYRWQRQLGQLRDAQGDIEGAIDAYETALKMLRDRLRLDIASSNLNYQFAFNVDAQTPIHTELMDLLFRDNRPEYRQKNLQRVREVSTSLLETQLTSFLQEPCNVTDPQKVDNIIQQQEQQVALFYPVVLPNRVEVIVKFPGEQDLFHFYQPVSDQQFRETLNKLKLALEEDYTYEAVNSLSQDLYEWLIQPVEEKLQSEKIDTLVFTLDRQLQSIPMAVLYDGEKYLIDKYAISEVLGLSFDGTGEALPQADLKIMAAGLSTIPKALPDEIRYNFQPLANVTNELEAIKALESESGTTVVTLADEAFTTTQFNARLNEDKFPVVHLATHGQFSVNPKSTFLITYSPPDSASTSNGALASNQSLIDVNELASLFRVRGQIRLDSIELLVLNACETAAGDDLATLGIAGTAVRAGAQSAIASLWTLDDTPSVDFTQYLYKYLSEPDISRAEALRQAQLQLKQNYQHPRYWSPYILAGSWLPLTTSRSNGSVSSSMSN